MNELLRDLLVTAAGSAIGLALVAMLLTIVPRLPGVGRRFAEFAARPPLLDVIVSIFTWAPWVVGAIWAGWIGLLGSFIGQVIALQTWIFLHELIHRRHVKGPRIVKFINRRFGRWRNHFALWVTIIGVPVLAVIRFAQVVGYPWLVLLLGLPRYRHADWVSVSRHKFDGLVGHDLIWCLYCDWMTGVYSLGAEMLRNVESFWCPIRFDASKKCANCTLDFPDIDGGWVKPDGSMADVEAVMERMYGEGKPSAWFGHPVRLTVDRKPIGDGNAAATGKHPPE